MPYVMVPVPEEHVQEAMQAVLRIAARAGVTDWDIATVEQFFGSLDEASKSVLSAVARSSISRGPIQDHDVARATEISQREVLGVARELNEAASQASHPALIGVQMITENLPNGRTQEVRMMSMTKGLAELVRAAERAERETMSSPSPGGTG